MYGALCKVKSSISIYYLSRQYNFTELNNHTPSYNYFCTVSTEHPLKIQIKALKMGSKLEYITAYSARSIRFSNMNFCKHRRPH